MSVTLNNSDFQCLQDQIVDLKSKNYELAEKTRRGQADFEAAKAKICSLQLKLEEQERDFQVISSTLRQEINAVTNNGHATAQNDNGDVNNVNDNTNYKVKYKELALKNEELQQKYEETIEIAQQLDNQNKTLTDKIENIKEENINLKGELDNYKKEIDEIKKENEIKLNKTIEDLKAVFDKERKDLENTIENITNERENMKTQIDKLTAEVNKFDQRLEVENEERKIQERKGLQMVKELKRQLALEKNRKETLQKRIEHLLSQPPQVSSPISVDEATSSNSNIVANDQEIDTTQLSSTSSNGTNGNGSISTNGNSRANNQDTNSVGSWSFIANKTSNSNNSNNNKSNSNNGINETISLCSIDSGDKETVQHNCDTTSESSIQRAVANILDNASKETNLSSNISSPSSRITFASLSGQTTENGSGNNKQNLSLLSSLTSSGGGDVNNYYNDNNNCMLIEEQAALVDRLTKLQHEKWQLEEKLSYMEQANSSLTEDLANKSDIIKQYFMDQAIRALNSPTLNHNHNNSSNNNIQDGNYINIFNNNTSTTKTSRRISFPNNVNHLLIEKTSLKKVVDFLKEKSHSSSNEQTENISREATKKMQLMLEETLIKCIKLQENLDFVTSELNKHKS